MHYFHMAHYLVCREGIGMVLTSPLTVAAHLYYLHYTAFGYFPLPCQGLNLGVFEHHRVK